MRLNYRIRVHTFIGLIFKYILLGTINGKALVLKTETKGLLAIVQQLMHELQALFEGMSTGRMARRGKVDSASSALADKLHAFKEQYQTVKQKSTAHKAQLSMLADLEQEQRDAQDLLLEQKTEFASLADTAEKHKQLRTELTSAWSKKTALLKTQCELLTRQSDGLIRASLVTGQGMDEVRDRFKGLIAGSNVRSAKVDALFDEL